VSGHHLAQINVGTLHRPLDAPETAEFVAALEPINALAEAAPGFVWRLTDDDGGSSSYVAVPGADDPLLIVNFSVWADVATLKAFMYDTDHVSYLRRRGEWFARVAEVTACCWWIPAGTTPDVADGYRRLLHLREHGSSPEAWTLARPVDPPE
jgi:hypothetical protein